MLNSNHFNDIHPLAMWRTLPLLDKALLGISMIAFISFALWFIWFVGSVK